MDDHIKKAMRNYEDFRQVEKDHGEMKDESKEDRTCLDLVTDYIVCISKNEIFLYVQITCLLYTSPSPRDRQKSRMPSSA